jgi:hypothetical protein
MKRFKEAGLNPNLIYGQGSNGNSPNVLPHYQAPTYRQDVDPAINLPSALSAYQDFRVKDAQVDLLKANTDSVRAGVILKTLDAKDKEGRNEYSIGVGGKYSVENVIGNNRANIASYQSTILHQTIEDQINKLRLGNALTNSNIGLTDTKSRYSNLMGDYQSSVNKLYNVSTGASIISKLLPLLLRLR